jgi:hypothetical protein
MRRLMIMLLLGAGLLAQVGCDDVLEDLEDIDVHFYGGPDCWRCGHDGYYYEEVYVEDYWYEDRYCEHSWWDGWWWLW